MTFRLPATLRAVFAVSLLSLACGAAPPTARADDGAVYAEEPAKGATAHLHDAWDELLHAHVHDGRVDYLGLATNDLGKLDRYLIRLAQVQADTLPGPDRVAYWINLYNATLVRGVCARWRDGWRPDADGFGLYKAPLVRTSDGAMPLDALQHTLMLRRVPDIRLHAALCNGSLSSPKLRAGAYHGADVDSLLEVATHEFVNDPARNRFDDARRTATLSMVFQPVARGASEAELLTWLEGYTGRKLEGWTITYAEWNWGANAPGAPEPVIAAATRPAAAPAKPAAPAPRKPKGK